MTKIYTKKEAEKFLDEFPRQNIIRIIRVAVNLRGGLITPHKAKLIHLPKGWKCKVKNKEILVSYKKLPAGDKSYYLPTVVFDFSQSKVPVDIRNEIRFVDERKIGFFKKIYNFFR